MLIGREGDPDDADGVGLWTPDRSETLGRVKGGTVGVELLDETVGSPDGDDVADPEGVLITVLLEEFVGSPDEGDPPDEVMLDGIVGSLDGAEVVGNPKDELFDETVSNPEEAVELWNPDRSETLGNPKGGIVPEELLAVIVGTPDGAEMVGIVVNELFEDFVGDPEAAVDIVGSADGTELLASTVDELFKVDKENPEGAIEV